MDDVGLGWIAQKDGDMSDLNNPSAVMLWRLKPYALILTGSGNARLVAWSFQRRRESQQSAVNAEESWTVFVAG